MTIELKKFLKNAGFRCVNCTHWNNFGWSDKEWGSCSFLFSKLVNHDGDSIGTNAKFCCAEFEGKEK